MLPRAAARSRTTSRGTGSGPGLEDGGDVRAVTAQLGRERERQRAAAGEQDASAGKHALGLDERLCAAGGDHSRQRPAGKDDRAVVRARSDQHAAAATTCALARPPRPRRPPSPGSRSRSSGAAAGRRSARQRRSARGRGGSRDPSAFGSVTRKPGPGCLKIWPPSVGRSSTRQTESPAAAASAAAASPAGPPPTMRTS